MINEHEGSRMTHLARAFELHAVKRGRALVQVDESLGGIKVFLDDAIADLSSQ
jgi:hypothetical protein